MATSNTKQATAKKPPKKKLQRVKEAKAKNEEDSRNAAPIYGASDYRICRLFDVAHERWVCWTPNATGQKLVDSRVHRYGREAGYSNGEDESHFDSHLKAVEEQLRNIREQSENHPTTSKNLRKTTDNIREPSENNQRTIREPPRTSENQPRTAENYPRTSRVQTANLREQPNTIREQLRTIR